MNRKIFILTLAIFFTLSASSWASLARIDNEITTGAALSGNTLLFGDSIGSFIASDVQTHHQRWSYEGSNSTSTGIPAVAGDKVIFAQVTGEITCLKILSGSLIWQYVPTLNESTIEGLNDGVAVGGRKVYAAFTTGELKAFDLESGQVLWSYKSEQGLRTAPAYSDGLVFLGEYNGLFSILDADTGERVNGGGAGGAVNTPVVSNGNVYYSAWDGSIHAVQIKNVIPLWGAKAGEPITTSPVIREGRIIVGTASGKIVALSQSDGSILWSYDSQGGQLKLAASNGRVLAGTENDRVLVLNAKTGKLISEQSVDYALDSSTGDRLYYVSDNNLYVLE